jgi:selenocysteine lyase/cysteine desulfurase
MPVTGGVHKPIEAYRRLYPVTADKVWLNNASMGTLSAPVAGALRAYIKRHALGDISIEHDLKLVQRARETAARFINASPGEIAFTKNVADGLNIVAQGLDWKPGDRIVIADQEFPANVYPWQNLVKRGVELVKVASRDSRVAVEAIIEALEPRTRLVSLSWVEFSTGFRNDLKVLAKTCHERGILFCVDGIQGVGAFPLDVRETDVDVMATSSHKWLLAPTGTGWMYVRESLIDKIAISYLGQSSVSRGKSLDYLDFDLPLWPDARRFEPGILNYMGLVGLTAAIELFEEVGIDRIADRIKALTDGAVAGLLDRGYDVISSRNSAEWSGCVCFRSPKIEPAEIHRRLGERNIIISLRNDIVRISPHYYNDHDDIGRFLEALPR